MLVIPIGVPVRHERAPELVPLTPRERRQIAVQRRLAREQLTYQRERERAARTVPMTERERGEIERQRMLARAQLDYQRARERAMQIVERAEKKALRAASDGDLTVLEVAQLFGPQIAIEYAREWDIHPDQWARDMADEFELDISDIYAAFFDSPEGSTV